MPRWALKIRVWEMLVGSCVCLASAVIVKENPWPISRAAGPWPTDRHQQLVKSVCACVDEHVFTSVVSRLGGVGWRWGVGEGGGGRVFCLSADAQIPWWIINRANCVNFHRICGDATPGGCCVGCCVVLCCVVLCCVVLLVYCVELESDNTD